jgi:hypothetical protein
LRLGIADKLSNRSDKIDDMSTFDPLSPFHSLSDFPTLVETVDKIVQRKVSELVPAAEPPMILPEKVETALTNIGEGMKAIAHFLGGTTLPEVAESVAIMASVKQIFGGLAAHSGRNALDASLMKQNAIDTTHMITAAFDHLRKHTEELRNGERDSHIVDAEEDFKSFVAKENDSQAGK